MRREVVSCVVVRWRMPRRREMPPVARMFQLVTREQERGAASMSERRVMAGEISPPLNARRFMEVRVTIYEVRIGS